MPALSDYTSGTLSLTNGSTAFTGTGTGWLLAGFKEGDTIIDITGATEFMGVIATIDANGAGTLTKPWEGPTLVDADYRMRYQPDGARVSAQARNLIELLGNGNLQALAGQDFSQWARSMLALPGAANKLPYLDGANTAALTDFGDAARSILGLTAAADKLPYYTDANTAALTDLTAKARAILAKGDNLEVAQEVGLWEPIVSTTVAGVSFWSQGNLDPYREIRMLVDVAPSVATSVSVQVSTNNGSSWLNTAGDYVEQFVLADDTTVSSGRFTNLGSIGTGNVAAAVGGGGATFELHFSEFNQFQRSLYRFDSTRRISSGVIQHLQRKGMVAPWAPFNAIAVFPLAGDMVWLRVNLFGKR